MTKARHKGEATANAAARRGLVSDQEVHGPTS